MLRSAAACTSIAAQDQPVIIRACLDAACDSFDPARCRTSDDNLTCLPAAPATAFRAHSDRGLPHRITAQPPFASRAITNQSADLFGRGACLRGLLASL